MDRLRHQFEARRRLRVWGQLRPGMHIIWEGQPADILRPVRVGSEGETKPVLRPIRPGGTRYRRDQFVVRLRSTGVEVIINPSDDIRLPRQPDA